jgi:hypothetical protein
VDKEALALEFAQPWDVCFGADLVYDESVFGLLASTLHTVCGGSGSGGSGGANAGGGGDAGEGGGSSSGSADGGKAGVGKRPQRVGAGSGTTILLAGKMRYRRRYRQFRAVLSTWFSTVKAVRYGGLGGTYILSISGARTAAEVATLLAKSATQDPATQSIGGAFGAFGADVGSPRLPPDSAGLDSEVGTVAATGHEEATVQAARTGRKELRDRENAKIHAEL